MTKKLSKEELLKEEFERNLSIGEFTVSGWYDQTFWYNKMQEILPMYEKYLAENPDKVKETLIAFAWHAYNYALKQR